MPHVGLPLASLSLSVSILLCVSLSHSLFRCTSLSCCYTTPSLQFDTVACALAADGSARPGITEDVQAAINNKAKALNKARKKRRVPDELTEKTAVAAWKVNGTP